MDESRFYILSAKQLTGNISPDEVHEFNDIIYRNPGYRELYTKLEGEIAAGPSRIGEADESVLELLRQKISALGVDAPGEVSTTPVSPRHLSRSIVPLSVFAIALLAVFSFLYFSGHRSITQPSADLKANDIVTKPGSKTHLKLPDGTKVILNADSKISYPDNFMGNTREVTLEGEAYFEVYEDKSKPFVIHAKSMDIRVLGTVFNVKAYPQEENSEASLISGSIEVMVKNRTNGKVYLKPKEKIVISDPSITTGRIKPGEAKSTSMVSIQKIVPDNSDDAIDEIAWTDNKLVFHEEPFSSLAVKLGRWYGKTIRIRSEHLLETKFTGKFYNENIVQVLSALQKMGDFQYSHQKNEIVIW